jgi:lysophospholipase L1-like esterase
MKNTYFFLSGITILLFTACKTEFTTPVASNGSSDFTKYVAIGNSLTSGYADGALYAEGQKAAYPNLLAAKFQTVGGGTFTTPLMPEGNGLGFISGVSFRSKTSLQLVDIRSKCDKNSGSPIIGLAPVTPELLDPTPYITPIGGNGKFYNNMGVPGVKSYQIGLKGYAGPFGNPYFKRFASSPETTILQDALAQNPTFFSFWVGSNDVLLYAVEGGASNSLTSKSTFEFSINSIVTALVNKNTKGVIANIPDITAIPYFTTIPYNGLILTQEKATRLNAFSKYPGITFTAGANAFIIADTNAEGGVRKIQKDEFVLLDIPQDSIKCYGLGSLIPIPNKYVLISTEINEIKNAINYYNVVLKTAADKYNLAYVDMNSFMKTFSSSVIYNGLAISSEFIKGGAFSLDGIHLTPLGNALIANQFLLAINAKYGSTLSLYDVSSFKGVTFP